MKNRVEKRNKRNHIITIVSTVIIMFTYNQFTIYLNAPATIFENNTKIKNLGIKSYFSSSSEPIAAIQHGDIILFIYGNVFNLNKINTNRSNPWQALLDIYQEFGIDYLLQVMDGEFTMILIDQRVELDEAKIYVVGESVGILPIYTSIIQSTGNESIYVLSTENAASIESNDKIIFGNHAQTLVSLGTYHVYSLLRKTHAVWTFDPLKNIHTHYLFPKISYFSKNVLQHFQDYLKKQFMNSIHKRFENDTTTTRVVCIGAPDDFEYISMKRILQQICEDRGIVLEEYEIITSIEDNISDHTRVFMSTGIFFSEEANTENVSTSTVRKMMQSDYAFRKKLDDYVKNTLIPLWHHNVKKGIYVEFPWMNSQWLSTFLFIGFWNPKF